MFDSQTPRSNLATMLGIIGAALAALGGLTWYFTR
jgi:hypothetical protein